MRNLVLTTVGTSLLTNRGSGEERGRLRAFANASADTLDPADAALLQSLARQAAAEIDHAASAARRASAELNTLLGLYENRESEVSLDGHILVGTDTAQGHVTVDLLEQYLRKRGATHVERWIPSGFSTASYRAFSDGVRRLLGLCYETFPSYRRLGVRCVFNTLGGFKSQRDVLNIAGMFYADEILYVFEGEGQPLLRIPKLPIRIDEKRFVDHAPELLLLTQGQAVGGPSPVPNWLEDTLLDAPDRDGRRLLSSWGFLIWDQIKTPILEGALLPLPHLEWATTFERDFASLPRGGDRVRVTLQETLAEVSVLLQDSGGSTRSLSAHGGLRYTRYQGENRHLGHFRLNNRKDGGYRVSCEPVDGGLRLRRVGKHDAVNDSP